MAISDEKLSHLTHLVYEGIGRFDGVELVGDEEVILRTIRQALQEEFRLDDALDQAVRARLASYSRQIVEGSPEWDVLYRKSFDEELRKRRRT
jgi:hypothetical protein